MRNFWIILNGTLKPATTLRQIDSTHFSVQFQWGQRVVSGWVYVARNGMVFTPFTGPIGDAFKMTYWQAEAMER